MYFVKVNGSLIVYALNKLGTFSIQSLNTNQNQIYTKISHLVIRSLQADSVENVARNYVDVRFEERIHKWHHTGYHAIILFSVDSNISGN